VNKNSKALLSEFFASINIPLFRLVFIRRSTQRAHREKQRKKTNIHIFSFLAK
jgi:hypothetical protein